tara:strand:+ start:1258 stop:2196 length:939 start_codon:yes stop_codon:yes gene_type:complete
MNIENILNPLNSIKLIGMDNYFDELIKLYNSKRMPKVLLISGQKGLGKFTLVNHLVNYIFSKNSYDFKSKKINSDSEVYKKILGGTFDNMIFFKNEGPNTTKINDIRKLKLSLSKSNTNNKPRFIVLDDVEKLNINSSNALLKTIEEPSENNFFILIDNKENDIISTISSRCLKFKIFLNNYNKKKIIEALIKEKNIETSLKYESLNLTPGMFLKFNDICNKYEIFDDTEYLEKIKKILNLYKSAKDKNFINLSILLTDEYFYNLSIKNQNKTFLFNSVKNKIIHYINNFFIYNLNLNSILNLIITEFKHAK